MRSRLHATFAPFLSLTVLVTIAGCGEASTSAPKAAVGGATEAAQRAVDTASQAGMPQMPADPELERLGMGGVVANFHVLGQLCGANEAELAAYLQRERATMTSMMPAARFDADFKAAQPIVRRHLEAADKGYSAQQRDSTCQWALQTIRGEFE